MGIISRPASARASSSRLVCALLLVSLLLCSHYQAASAHGGIDDGHDEASSSSPPPAPSRKALIAVKVWCLVILLVLTFLGGMSPYFFRWNEAFLVLGTQFAAGVFLGTSLMHFLADSADTLSALVPNNNHYPFSYTLACVGFLATMLADCVVLAVAKRSRRRQTHQQTRVVSNEEDQQQRKEEDGHRQQQQHNPIMLVSRTSSFEDAVLLIVALCFHSVFEGIAIGVSPTKSDAWRNLWTIGLHKIFAAVAMGIALLRLIPKRPFLMSLAYSLAFAVSSPVGVGIGIAIIDASPNARGWVYGISMGFATGIFIYVAINHLMAKGYRPHEPCRVDRPFFKFLAVLLGVAVMAVVMIWD
jgi:solute carrier family 39 (zinc transporter), member 1/2/3